MISNSSLIGGREVRSFEKAFANAHGLKSGGACGSGTDALALTLRTLGVGPGDEVIVPGMTFVATAEAVFHVGATPVLADVDPVTLLLTTSTVDAVITGRTKAVIPVHLYGHIVPFDAIDEWKSRGLLVIEDAAQAHLGSWNNEYVGSHSDAACFSFYPGKNLGALGDGGMVLSTSLEVVEGVRLLRDHGRRSKYQHEVAGWCSRLDGLQAAVLGVKLRHLETWTDARRELAERYRSKIGDLLVPWEDGAVHHLMVARFADRHAMMYRLKQSGIQIGMHYPVSLSQHDWLRKDHLLPNSESAASQVLSLPLDPLMSEEEVDFISQVVKQGV